MRGLMRAFLLLLLALALLPLPAEARPTVSGTLVAYNPGAGRLQIRRADGVVKTIVLRQGAQFQMYGNRVSPAQFRQGMQVAVRVVGALNDDPLEADLLTDYGSSSQYVATNATSPYSTPVGNYATAGGAGGVSPGLPQLGGPSVLGPLGMGGNFPGALTNPGQPIPQGNSAFPQMIPGQPGMPAQPAPGGSPFTGEVISQQPGVTPTAPAPNPYSPAPYGQSATGYGQPTSNASLIDGGTGGSTATPSAMFGGQEEDEEEGGSQQFGGNTLGMQVLQFEARVMTVDAYNRVLTVVPAGANYPLQVSLPNAVYPVQTGTGNPVPLERIQPGQGVQVHGLRNAAGIVEARALSVAL